MQLLYVHHAERDKSNKDINRQNQDITKNGEIEALLLAEKLKQIKVTAIYTSSYLRCKHTAELINKYINVDIYEDVRLNEICEDWEQFQIRNMEAIDEIVKKHNKNNDLVICVTSGVNLSAFIYYFTKIKPSKYNPWIQGVTCSPVLFSTDNKCF